MTRENLVALAALNRKHLYEQRSVVEALISKFTNPVDTIGTLITEKDFEKELEEFKKLDSLNVTFVPGIELNCPERIGLYVRTKGDIKRIIKCQKIAVVGTRDMSFYGKEMTQAIIEKISREDPSAVIVSGLAIGIDTVAHRAALDCGLATIPVYGSGLEKVYPSCNTRLAAEIENNSNCAVISPIPPGMSPLAINFINRNDVIAQLCERVIVVESKLKGGAMVTARYANDYGKEVYAVPGRLTDVRSLGCNHLIESKIAELYAI